MYSGSGCQFGSPSAAKSLFNGSMTATAKNSKWFKKFGRSTGARQRT